MGRFEGKSVVVTGAGSGMGRATALAMVAEGARVMGLDVSSAGLEEVAASAAADAGGAFVARTTDIANRAECHSAVAAAVEAFDGIDVLCNVAGVLRAGHSTDFSDTDWDLVMGVNLGGTFWMCQAALPHLEERRGNIVNIASNAGLMGQAYCAAYCASKAGVINMTKALAMEYAKRKVRINVVCPGLTNTPMASQDLFPEDVDWKLIQPYMGFRRGAEPEGIAEVVLFVASDAASNMHGSIVSVDNGLTAG